MDKIDLYIVDYGHTFTISLEREQDECYFVNEKFQIEKAYFNKDYQEWYPGTCLIKVEKEYAHNLMDTSNRWDRLNEIVKDINKEFSKKLKEVFQKLMDYNKGKKYDLVYAERHEPEFYPVFKKHKVNCKIENEYWLVAIVESNS